MRGRRLDNRYELIELLGSGGMGEVWRARDEELDREVAVKILLPARDDTADRDEALARFRREARVAASLDSARTQLRATLETVETDGLLGHYAFKGHQAQDRPVWVDRLVGGKWKQLGTVKRLTG